VRKPRQNFDIKEEQKEEE